MVCSSAYTWLTDAPMPLMLLFYVFYCVVEAKSSVLPTGSDTKIKCCLNLGYTFPAFRSTEHTQGSQETMTTTAMKTSLKKWICVLSNFIASI